MATEKEILQALWREAYASEEGREIPCGTKTKAMGFRFQLYNAVKAVRSGKVKDEELLAAVEGCSVGFADEAKTVLHIRRRASSGILAALREELSPFIREEVQELSPQELEAQESLKRVQERLAAPATPEEAAIVEDVLSPALRAQVNKYYTRN